MNNLELIQSQHKKVYSRITLLDNKEAPIENLLGVVTSGSNNIDGKSACRRTCSLSMSVPAGSSFTKELWTLKSKVKIEIGLQNEKKITYFPLGIYLLTSFSISQALNSITISLQGKDKMCLLDGTIGGKLSASHDFGYIDEIQEGGDIKKVKVPIKEIIREAVHTYANEPYENIIINDLPEHGLELQTYRGKDPIYFLVVVDNDQAKVKQVILDSSFQVFQEGETDSRAISTVSNYYKLNSKFTAQESSATKVTLIENGTNKYYVSKYEYGDVVGYKQTALTYAGELTANIGEALTSILDKIKNQLGEFEYFYNLQGQFVFQKKKNYLQGNYNQIGTDSYQILKYNLEPFYSFIFNNEKLQTNISRTPAIQNIKNDFITWGKGTSANGNDIPIHCRIALDKKPTGYISIEENEIDVTSVDWREYIYQMAKDYYKHHNEDTFLQNIASKNSDLYPTGITGYEQYYEDIEGFWRMLYDPFNAGNNDPIDIGGKDYYYDNKGWNIEFKNNPESIIFWFDFIDSTNSLIQYSIPAIGDRTMPESDNSVKSVYYNPVPTVLFYAPGETIDLEFKGAYSTIQLPNDLSEMFSISSRGISAIDKIYSNINNNVLEQETISITCIPIYYLEPNTRILVQNNDIDINGDYIVQSFSLPLTYNGTMSIQASKVNPDLIIQ